MVTRLLPVGVVVAGALGLTVYLLWPYLVGAGVLAVAWRVVGRDVRSSRRRRPRSSWSSLGRTAALMFAAWNSRWLKPTVQTRVSVPASTPGTVTVYPMPVEHDAGVIPF